MRRTASFLVLLMLAWGCANGGEDRVLGVNASGTVAGTVFFDLDGTRTRTTGDSDVPGAIVRLSFAGSTTEGARTETSGSDGTFIFREVPVGRYKLNVDSGSIGDSARVASLDTSAINVTPGDTALVEVVLSFPTIGAGNIAGLPAGTRVFVEGVALNDTQAFGDTTLHVADTSGVVRVTDARGDAVAVGDSVRISGRTGLRGTELVIRDGRVTRLGIGNVPQAEIIATATAASVDSVAFNSALVRVEGVTVTDTATSGPDFTVTVDDGSGPLEMLLDGDVGFSVSAFKPPAELDVTGLLVLSDSGLRQLKPRTLSDVDLRIPFVDVAGARAATPGDTLLLLGVMLNTPGIFGDSSASISDASASVRLIGLRSDSTTAGDSVRVRGVVATAGGQPVIRGTDVVVLDSVGTPTPTELATVLARSATGGVFDAGLVKVINALVTDTATSAEGLVLTVDDGTGTVDVLVDADLAVDASAYVPGVIADATGILVPSAGVWRILPRQATDIDVKTPFLPIATARMQPPGDSVVVAGIALADVTVFGDNSLHVADSSAAIRAIGVSGSVFSGDSLRLLGTIGSVNGQPVLTNVTANVIGSTTVPAPLALTSAVASNAAGGLRDAAYVKVDSVTISARTVLGIDVLATANDGSGDVDVVFDVNAGLDLTSVQVGAVLDVAGLLVPTGAGKWRLKPRVQSDITVRIHTIASARQLAQGDTATIRGAALNVAGVFGDSTVNLDDATASIRAVELPAGVFAEGDTLVIRGTLGQRGGEPVIRAISVSNLGAGAAPVPADLSTAGAASAAGGSADGALARVQGVVISDTATVGVDFVVTGSDGSGDLDIVLDADAAIPASQLVPGVVLDATGLLVPSAGVWRMFPRSSGDLVVRVPLTTIAVARATAPGDSVLVVGIALNNLAAFGDNTLHLSDSTATIRLTGVSGLTIFAGDTVQVRGSINLVATQPVVAAQQVSRLGNGVIPPPTTLLSGLAATANGGTLDAGLVTVDSVSISVVSVVGPDVVLAVSDGTGNLSVVIDADAAINTTEFVPGAVLRVTGLLVATNAGVWQLKPRSSADVAVLIPVVTIATAVDTSQTTLGSVVTVAGGVLNQRATFGDSTVHLADATGAMRTTQTPLVFVFVGDSVRATGTLDTLNGQVVMTAPTFKVVGAVGSLTASVINTATAAIAFGGRLDAALVSVSNALISGTVATADGLEIIASDGSGNLTILLDTDAGLSTAGLTPGANINVIGLLVPRGGGVWVLKPRTDADITIN